jgi:Fe-S cluster assembly iron-binding protein IscA
MLHITPEAGLAIQKLTREQGVSEDGGLRMEARANESDDLDRTGRQSVEMSVAALPDETDVVVTEETTGARVMLDAVTADYVENKTLDVSDTVESTPRFSLSGQGATTD